jgi:ribosomal protein S18 acetylase RimI-like enzyme
MNQEELLQLSDLNLAESYREISRWNPNTDMAERGDILFVSGAGTFPAINFVIRVGDKPRSSADILIERAKEFFAARKRSFSIIVREHLDKDLLDTCKKLELFQVANAPGMVLERMIEDKPLPGGVRVQQVRTEAMARDFAEVTAQSFTTLGLPEDAGRSVFSNSGALLAPHLYLFVAYLEDKPASCAMAMLSHGIAGIYYVGTIENARGMGLAEHCTRAAGNAALKLGARCVVLQASVYGEPVYRRMGYREFTRYPWFICPSREKTA